MSHRIAGDEAVRDARVTAGAIARQMVGPQVDVSNQASLGPGSVMDGVLRHRLLDGSVAHLRIWLPSGRVLWSDEATVRGRTYTMPTAVRRLFRTSGTVSELPDEEKPEVGAEADEGDLLEVYVGAEDVAGRPFVLETYTSRERLAHNTQTIFLEVGPIGLAALLLFALVTLPLAVSLARTVERGQQRRTEILRHSLDAWSHERRRLAQRLHDGVVQDLSAVGYTLHWILEELPTSARQARSAGARAASLLVDGTTSLRTVVGDLLVPDDDATDLPTALAHLAAGAGEDGVEVVVDLEPRDGWEREVARVVTSVVREGLVNVVKHARARVATVTVRSGDGRVRVTVADDGQGPGGVGAADGDPHVGLEILARSLEEVGGRLDARPGSERGFVLTATLPHPVAATSRA
jgi:signal transduction histidine kinase